MGTAPSATELIFLSTLSLRRATGRLAGYDAGNQNFYPRSPCGERQLERRYLRLCSDYFYPRSPCGERPFGITAPHRQTAISIHALLAESDIYLILVSSRFKYFYPRSPCGERLQVLDAVESHYHISIHALLAESDMSGTDFYRSAIISIHALLAESDPRDWRG